MRRGLRNATTRSRGGTPRNCVTAQPRNHPDTSQPRNPDTPPPANILNMPKFLAALAIAVTAFRAGAAPAVVAPVKNEVKRYLHDAKSLALAPLEWNRHQWARLGEGVGLVAAVYAVDRPVYDIVQRNRAHTTDRIAHFVTPFGSSRAEYLSGLMIIGGAAFNDTNLRDAGRDSLESEVLAAGIVTPALKYALGRARPIADIGTYHFRPFGGDQSFPSGHSTNSFAFATAVAQHYDGWLVPAIAYTVATSIAVSRVNDRAHFASDVVAGALIGRAVAKGVFYRHKNVTVAPTIINHHAAIAIRIALKEN